MKRVYKLCLGLMMLICLSNYSVAQTALGSNKDLLSELKKGIGNNSTRVSGTSVKLRVSASQSFDGQVNFKQSDANSEFLIGEIENVAGSSFYVKVSEQSLQGHILLKATKEAYKYYSDKNGNAYVSEVPINSIVCIDYENLPTKTKSNLKTEADVVAQQAVASLQSLPGAAGCVLLDFDGYNMPAGNLWNNGNAINAAASGMSAGDIQEFWEVVSEDYRPFNLNVTTDENVFNTYPRTRRRRAVVTPTNTAAPGAGGVAYIGSFNWDNDVPCWIFVLGGKSGGDAASHEIGHTFGLNHDGRYINGDVNNIEEYFEGLQTPQTAWAPIMGAGYYEAVVQWSKGEYQYADNIAGVYAPHIGKNGDDDVAMIADPQWGVGYRGDDYGNDQGSAAALTYNASGAIDQKNGIIGSEADWDFFSFSTGGGNVSINANTVSRDGDLDIIIRLYNSSGAQIGSYTDDALGHLNASMNVNLAAGSYYVSIDGTGSGDPSTGGYSAYGSIGSYSVTGTIPPGGGVAPSTGLVTTYKDINYTGFSGGFSVGDYNLAALKALGVEDNSITSVKITEGYKIILYFDDNFTGQSMEITADNNYVGNFNDQVTSLQVRPNGNPNLAGTYYLQNRMSGLVMDVWGLSTADGASINQGSLNNGLNQQFTLTHLGNGNYSVIAKHSGKALDVVGISTANGALMNQWTYVNGPNQHFIFVSTGDGFYKLIPQHSGLVVEVSTNNSGEQLHQWWNAGQLNSNWKLVPVVAPPPVNGTGDGLTGNYFNGMNFETPVYSRVDANINVDWGNGSPNAAVNADAFSARWSGQIQPRYSETYTFYANTDNGRRVWINGQLVIDKWIDDWGTEYTGTISLVAGQKYDFKMEYFEDYGGANAKLEWSSASQAREVISKTQLYSNPLPAVSISSPANNATFTSPAGITITSNASDNGSIAKVDYYNGTALLGTATASPYSFTWSNVAAGTYTLTARATDNQGGITVSGTVTVKVNQGTTANKAPTISLTSPANGSSSNAPATISIAANAADTDGTVTKVDFYNGTTLLFSDATSPYSYTWTSIGAGTYTISAKATDNSGAVTASGSVTVTVQTVATDVCSGLATYVENNGYLAGNKVKNAGHQYECKEWPYSGWCNGAAWAYAPGTGSYWTDAWYDRGACSANIASATTSTESTIDLSISPNPVQGDLHLSYGSSFSGTSVVIIDVNGKMVYQSAASEAINTSDINAGIYTLIFMTSDHQKITKRFVKIK